MLGGESQTQDPGPAQALTLANLTALTLNSLFFGPLLLFIFFFSFHKP